ncbi:unnamed protein product [Mytilus edulis]|uniref:Uncharacterized protein n=1 Tax=Mytilus edulis TaxID=6550 RepID=A0A8S3SXB2_MYTED|nr:unnamed protein product [Mytilus edulis]
MKQAQDIKYKSKVGDSLKLRISDPFRHITTGKDNVEVTGIRESRVVYHACICRAMCVSHETGLLCYNSASSSVPVAQFIGPQPFSENLKTISLSKCIFSNCTNTVKPEIIECGDNTNIAIGICPGKTYPINNQPGWQRGSIAYHADDGEAGAANSIVDKCTKGDKMSLFCDVVSKQLIFFKNDQEKRLFSKVKQLKIDEPRGGYWPMIGMHSPGECVKLHKDQWTPDPDYIPPKPAAFNTCKFGNLWISPAINVSLRKKSHTTNHCGWMILHNPTKVLIGYKISPELIIKNPVGLISRNAAKTFFLTKPGKYMYTRRGCCNYSVDSHRADEKYTTDQIRQLFEDTGSGSTYTHRASVLGRTCTQPRIVNKDTALGDVETLQNFRILKQHQGSANSHVKQEGYKLEVFKNCILVESYLLKRGRYILDLVELDKTKADYIIKRPKCPSFLYPSNLQKGMKVVVKLNDGSSDDQFADAVISEIFEGGGYYFEYTSPGKVDRGNEKIFVGTMDCG